MTQRSTFILAVVGILALLAGLKLFSPTLSRAVEATGPIRRPRSMNRRPPAAERKPSCLPAAVSGACKACSSM